MYVKKKDGEKNAFTFFLTMNQKNLDTHVEHPISFLEGEQKIVKPSPLMNAPVFDEQFSKCIADRNQQVSSSIQLRNLCLMNGIYH